MSRSVVSVFAWMKLENLRLLSPPAEISGRGVSLASTAALLTRPVTELLRKAIDYRFSLTTRTACDLMCRLFALRAAARGDFVYLLLHFLSFCYCTTPT